MDSIQNNVSFQGYVPKKEKRANTAAAVIAGPLAATGIIATYGIANPKAPKVKGIMNKIKNNAKLFTEDCKNIIAGACKYVLRQDKWAAKVAKLANNDKRIFGASFVVFSLLLSGATKLGADLGAKFRHRND